MSRSTRLSYWKPLKKKKTIDPNLLSTPDRYAHASKSPTLFDKFRPTHINELRKMTTVIEPKIVGTRPTLIILDDL